MADAPPSSIDFLDPARQPDELGRLGPYRVLDTLGVGGMGRVFLAEDLRLRRRVALKVMNDKFAATPNSRKRFLEEARAMAAVDNDNVVRIYEVGEHNRTPFMAMELLKGGILQPSQFQDPERDYLHIISLGRQICHGLAAAHQRQIIHRDIKPANLWIEQPGGRVKVLDFGLALAAGPMDQLAGRGSVVGTPGYLSPEQARNETLDDRSDLYSVGIVLFELCTGRLPFQTKSIPLMLVSIITHPVPKVRDIHPDVPRPLADVIDRTLAKEARERPASAEALEQELADAARLIQSDSHAALSIVTEAAPATGPAGRRTSPAADEDPARAKWSPLQVGAIAGAVLAILLLVGATVLLLGGGSRDDDPSARGQRPAGVSTAVTGAKPATKPSKLAVTTASLRPLELQGLTAVKTRVGSGELATLNFHLVNSASGPGEDPAKLHARQSTVAVCRLYLEGDDGVRRSGYALPLRRRPRQLPAPGKRTALTFRIETDSIPLGTYTAIVSLETPAGEAVAEAETELQIVRNLAQGPLTGFETLRSWAGTGADTTVGTSVAGDAGSAEALTLAGLVGGPPPRQQHIYLRFDLGRVNRLRDRLQNAVLLLTLLDKSATGPFEIRAYAVGGAVPALWSETGEDALQWSETPSASGLGKLAFLGTITADNSGNLLKDKADAVRLVGPELDDAVRDAGDALTIVLVRSRGQDKPLRFASKEHDPEQAPGLALQGGAKQP